MKVWIVCLLLVSTVSLAQIPGSNNPNLSSAIKWQQIKSPHFKVIYTEGNEEQAQHVTHILERIHEPAARSLGVTPRRFPIVLQNHTTIPNGFVTVGPYRSEFYTTAPQNYLRLGNDLWLERLAVHEYRHMAQFEKALSPFNKAAYFLTGEFGAGFFASIAAPAWFFEGDAVGIETAAANSGRGVIPSFLMPFKANLIEKGGFNYYKQYLGSYRDFVPDHYVTGYLMTTDLKNRYGVDVWDRIMKRSFGHPLILFTFSKSIRKETGVNLVKSYKKMLDTQKELFTEQLSKVQPSSFEVISTPDSKSYTNYQYPQIVAGENIIALKSGLGHIPQLVMIDHNGRETKLLDLGLFNDIGYISANSNRVVWTEYISDPRWQNRNYLVIKSYDLRTSKLTTLSKKTKYTSVSVSINDDLLIVTEQTSDGEHRLTLLDTAGKRIRTFENIDNSYFSCPTFDTSGQYIYCLKHENHGKTIIRLSITSGHAEEIRHFEGENVGALFVNNEHLYYNSSFNGIDNVYRLNLSNGTEEQITSAKYGAFNATISGETLYYSDYSVDGFQVVKVPLSEIMPIPKSTVENISIRFEQKMIEQEGLYNILYKEDSTRYPTRKYNRFTHSIRPVSWGIQQSSDENSSQFGIVSRDLLGSTNLSGGMRYNHTEQTWRSFANYSWQLFYPIIDVEADWGSRSLVTPFFQRHHWQQHSLRAGLRVPLALTRSRMSTSASIGVSTTVNLLSGLPTEILAPNSRLRNGELYLFESSISYQRLLKQSKLDVQSRWGQSISAIAKTTPAFSDFDTHLIGVESNVFLPGIFKHHGIKLKGGYQIKYGENLLSSAITVTRGYLHFAHSEFVNSQINYAMPLATMDWHLGPFVNLQRMRLNIFFDEGHYQNETSWNTIRSTGSEVLFNFNLMRYLLHLDAGMRYTYRISQSDSQLVAIFLGVSI